MSPAIFFSGWSFDPPIMVGCLAIGLLYGWGARYSSMHHLSRSGAQRRVTAFVTGLLVLFLALQSPLDLWADRLLWVHMLQHELLTMVVAPLLLLGGSTMTIWRAFPLEVRRRALRRLIGWTVAKKAAHWFTFPLMMPVVGWILFVGDFAVWHIPALYDLALERQPVHDLEHVLFLSTALFFWAQVMRSLPYRHVLTPDEKVIFLGAAAVLNTLMDLVFIVATTPLYPYYAALPRSARLPPALLDQSIAGGIMEGLGTGILFVALIIVLIQSAHAGTVRQQQPRPATSTRTRSTTGAFVLGQFRPRYPRG